MPSGLPTHIGSPEGFAGGLRRPPIGGGSPRTARLRPAVSGAFGQPVQQWRLRRQDALARGVEREPRRPVDLRELPHRPGPRRPLDREAVRVHGVGVQVSLERPRGDDLAATLPDLPELHELARRRRRPELLTELAQRTRARILPVVVLTLGDRPGADIALGPERSARVDEQDLASAVAPPVQENPGAPPRRHRRRILGPRLRRRAGGGARSDVRPRPGGYTPETLTGA